MKRIFIAVFFILLSFSFGIYTLFETENICNRIITEIESSMKDNEEILENSNHQKRLDFYKKVTDLNSLWEKNSDFFYLFFNNDDIKNIELNMEKIPEHAKNGEAEASYLCLVECLEELEYIKNGVKPIINNIF